MGHKKAFPREWEGDGEMLRFFLFVIVEHLYFRVKTFNNGFKIRMLTWHNDSDEIFHTFIDDHSCLYVEEPALFPSWLAILSCTGGRLLRNS